MGGAVFYLYRVLYLPVVEGSVINLKAMEGAMLFTAPVERLYAPVVACWWLGMVVCMHWWAGLGASPVPPRRHLRLIADNGKLV
jgi:hypothetical protein